MVSHKIKFPMHNELSCKTFVNSNLAKGCFLKNSGSKADKETSETFNKSHNERERTKSDYLINKQGTID